MASSSQKEKDDIAATISKLAIDSGKTTASSKSKKAKKPVADSWEDEDVSDEEAEDDDDDKVTQEMEAGTSTPSSLTLPTVPPPTPASPLG
ncbi:hypothetical protein TARUN_10250, partial [Trichoderma arundinaceum]